MSQKTAIGWTDVTWNPAHGCSIKSTECRSCYAMTLSLRYGQTTKPWTPANAAENVILKPHKLTEPLRDTKAYRGLGAAAAAAGKTDGMLVFVNSMSDLFHEQIPDEFILAVWAVMEAVPRHTFQILTKRPERMRALLGEERPPTPPAPPYERRAVPDREGYEIDTLGTVWSSRRGGEPVALAPDPGEQGHCRVTMHGPGGRTRELVHRLALTVFDRQPVPGEQACHRDGDASNNRIENLYWGTQVDNWDDSRRHRTERRYFKLDPRQVAELRIAALRGESAYALGKRYGISDTQARNIIRGDQWGFKVLDNAWLGTSIGLRQFVGRAEHLRATPAAARFISAEPLLGPLFMDRVVRDHEWSTPNAHGYSQHREWADGRDAPELDLADIDWLIAGGESGSDHRPMEAEWVRWLRDGCQVFGTAFFFKQWGGARPGGEALLEGREWREFPRVAPDGAATAGFTPSTRANGSGAA